MKNSKIRRALLLAACAVLLVTLSVGATLAYLTSQDQVTNTFTVGKVKITLDEAKVNKDGDPVNDAGEEVELEDAPRVASNEYHLMPGHEYTKDPTVTVKADSELSYIRVLVTINKKAALDAIGVTPYDVFIGEDLAKWVPVGMGVATGDDSMLYEFRYFEKVSTADAGDKKLEPLFTSMKIPGNIINDQLTTLEGLEIDIIAQAIQADGFDTADEAWNAWTPRDNDAE